MKAVVWLGDSLKAVRAFPDDAKSEAGYQLNKVQEGEDPSDWKPMITVGAGVREIRIKEDSGAFRVLYVAKFEDAVYVLHAFQKKTQKTRKQDIDLASERYKALLVELGEGQ